MKLLVSQSRISRVLQAWLLLCVFLPLGVNAAPNEREPAFRDNFYDVAVRDGQSWIVGYYGTILHSSDGGLNWAIQKSPTQEALFRVVFLDAMTGWISGSYGTLLHTRDGGRSWHRQATQTEEHLLGLHFVDAERGWVVGSRGTILRTGDGGKSWVSGSASEDIILNDVRFVNPQQGWAVGEFGRIYSTRDGGRTWAKTKSPVEVSFISGESRNLFRLLFRNSTAGWAFGLDGTILKTQGGQRWQVANPDGAVPPGIKRHHLFSAAFFNGRKWAVGERGTILVAGADNDQWQPARSKVPPLSLNGIAFGSGHLGLIVGNRGLILRTQNGGDDWKPVSLTSKRPGKDPIR
jgi:photosystem II stability/assembly factor-like uncharacterized protein